MSQRLYQAQTLITVFVSPPKCTVWLDFDYSRSYLTVSMNDAE